MPRLAGQEHIYLAANLSLVDAAILAQVLRHQHPVNGMVFLLPVIKITQAFLVIPAKRTWLYMEVLPYGTERYGIVIEDRLLKKHRTQQRVPCHPT